MKSNISNRIFYAILSFFIAGIALGCVGDTSDVTPSRDSDLDNNPPVAEDWSAVTNRNLAVEIPLPATDQDNDDLISVIDENPVHGSISAILPGNMETTYIPEPGFSGSDSFTFHVNDGLIDSNIARVDIIVSPVPEAPSDLSAFSQPGSRIILEWQDNSGDEEGFIIERKEGMDGDFEQIQIVRNDIATLTDAGLTDGSMYYYRVRATKITGDSNYSNEVGAIAQSDPYFTNFLILKGPHFVIISFTTPDEVAVKIEYGLSTSYGNETEPDIPGIEHNVTIEGLVKDTAYCCRAVVVEPSNYGLNRTFKTKDYYTNNEYADTYVESLSGVGCSNPEASYGDPVYMLNDVRGSDGFYGSLDVFSLRYCSPTERFATVTWSGKLVQNGTGTDFVFFENGFKISDSGTYGNYFMEPVVIFLSRDGENWVAMPHDYDVEGYEKDGEPANERRFVADVHCWHGLEELPGQDNYPGQGYGFGGIWPVFYDCELNPVDPFYFNGFDPENSAGGDHFDLDDLDNKGEAGEIKRNGFKYLKFEAAWLVENPDTGKNFPFPDNGSFDAAPECDGVYARYFVDE